MGLECSQSRWMGSEVDPALAGRPSRALAGKRNLMKWSHERVAGGCGEFY
jgi:hypothetical protein